MKTYLSHFFPAAVIAAACAGALAARADEPLTDVKDTSCLVTLNWAGISCVRSNCTLTASVLVSRSLTGSTPGLFVRSKETGLWETWSSRYEPYTYGDFTVYQIDAFPGSTRGAYEFIPFVVSETTRYFDHNTLSGDFENYAIGGEYGHRIERTRACGVYD